jgi:predicted DNA binding CopG/RHH family protein
MKRSAMPEIPYTVRLAPKLLERIEKTARERGISPRKLIRAVLAEHLAEDRGA